MGMKSKDLIMQEKTKLSQAFAQAVKAGDEEGVAKAFADFAENIQEGIFKDAEELAQQQADDTTVLTGRGVRQLTTQENLFYNKLISAMKDSNPRQALTNIDVVMPETVIDSVMDDIRQAHPLLNAITFVNTMGQIKMLVNKQGIQTALWGPLTGEITKELSGAFGEINTGLYKLSAFMPVAKALLDLGPQWLDRYVRETLSEANAVALEAAIVDGDGNGKPIGMTRSVADDVTVTAGVYPRKKAVVVKSFAPTEYGALLKVLVNAPNERKRAVNEVVMVVNPSDYLTKIMPATTFMTSNGTYAANVFPFPTRVIQSAALSEGQAVVGLPYRYFMGIGSPQQGKIEYDDSYQFLEDNRVYITKMYGNGMPLDDNAFILLDISQLAPANLEVTVKEAKGTVTTKSQGADAK